MKKINLMLLSMAAFLSINLTFASEEQTQRKSQITFPLSFSTYIKLVSGSHGQQTETPDNCEKREQCDPNFDPNFEYFSDRGMTAAELEKEEKKERIKAKLKKIGEYYDLESMKYFSDDSSWKFH